MSGGQIKSWALHFITTVSVSFFFPPANNQTHTHINRQFSLSCHSSLSGVMLMARRVKYGNGRMWCNREAEMESKGYGCIYNIIMNICTSYIHVAQCASTNRCSLNRFQCLGFQLFSSMVSFSATFFFPFFSYLVLHLFSLFCYYISFPHVVWWRWQCRRREKIQRVEVSIVYETLFSALAIFCFHTFGQQGVWWIDGCNRLTFRYFSTSFY